MKKEKNDISINKIDIDSKTNEPKIIEVDVPKETETETKVDNDNMKQSIGSQLKMDNLFPEENEVILKRQQILKKVLSISFFVLVIGVLVYTFYKDFFSRDESISVEKIIETLSKNWMYFFFALFALAFCFFLKAAKLSILCKKLTGKWHFRTCFETGILGHYYNYITPLAVGGQPFEIMYMTKHGIKSGVSSSIPIATYFLHQLAFVILGIVALILFRTDALGTSKSFSELTISIDVFYIMAWIGLGFGLVLPVAVIAFSLMPKFGGKVVSLIMTLGGKLKIVRDPKAVTEKVIDDLIRNANSLKEMAGSFVTFSTTFLLSFGEHLALCSIAYFSLKLFGFDLLPNPNGFNEWLQVLELCLILYAAVSFIPTPGNAGAADFSFFTLFQTSIVAGLSFAAMLFWRLASFYSFLIVGFALTRITKKRDKKENIE